jgi:hypothetical protein
VISTSNSLTGVDHFGGRVVEDCQRGVFVKTRDERLGVGRNRRDVHKTPASSPEDLGEAADLARNVSRGIDRCVPRARGEGVEIVVAVTQAMVRVGEQPWVGRAAMEQRHVVPIGQQRSHYVAPDELGPADHEDLHAVMLSGVLAF